MREALVYVFGAPTFLGRNWENKKEKGKYFHL